MIFLTNLVGLLRLKLKLQKGTIQLVNHENGLNTLTKSLTQNGLSLNANRLNAINDDKSTIGDTESGGNLGREIYVAGRVDQVDQELARGGVLGDLISSQLVVQRNTSGLDGDSAVLLVSTGIRETLLAGVSLGDDTSGGDQRIGQSGLTVIHTVRGKGAESEGESRRKRILGARSWPRRRGSRKGLHELFLRNRCKKR
jgi:hypothetical protein